MAFANVSAPNFTSIATSATSVSININPGTSSVNPLLHVYSITVDSGVTAVTPGAKAGMAWGSVIGPSPVNSGVVSFIVWGVWTGGASSPTGSITFTGTATNGGKLCTSTWSGGLSTTTGQLGATNNAQAGTGAPSLNLVAVNSGSLIYVTADNSGNASFTPDAAFTGSGTTSVWNTNHRTCDEYLLSSPGGTQTCDYTAPTTAAWNMTAAEFIAAAGAPVSIQAATQCIVFP